MTQVVVDASVIVKWLSSGRDDEPDVDRAEVLWSGVRNGAIELLEPPHWLAEVAAVLTRISPTTADDDVANLFAMDLAVLNTPGMYLRACELARTLGAHVFDTLYHAVALETPRTTLVTADDRYYRKAARLGAIVPLGRWRCES